MNNEILKFDGLTKIGEGNFGVVYKGILCRDDRNILVAVKTAQNISLNDENDINSFFKEVRNNLRVGHNKHVLGIEGVYYPDKTLLESKNNQTDSIALLPAIVTKYMPNGDVETYLKNYSRSFNLQINDILRFCRQSAAGLRHLHSIQIIHRDIAARNCLLDESLNLKISDYGLAQEGKDYGDYNFVQSDRQQEDNQNDQLPLPWLALEVFEERKFTNYSDIWAMGIMFWEFFTRCKRPYGDLHPKDIWQFLSTGSRNRKPLYCPQAIFELSK